MTTLAEFYAELLSREGVPTRTMADPWPPALSTSIANEVRSSATSSGILGLTCPIPLGTSNQSVGNKVEQFTMATLAPQMSVYAIAECRGHGYPDRELHELATSLRIPLEIKATSHWDPNDSNRRVLSSASDKLRTFPGPIHHLMLTIQYSNTAAGAVIEHLRLDFLEPTTDVNIRLEASVSHRLLSQGPHTAVII